ncbi:recombinase family protein [uncultured Clostridium sp.]|uniref:recombinase family protein n=1 Tax=uncultured Clostridium sp. TaxID=59620 RepID=UPI0026235FB5|nr:recombinase family protein [uncultured Clostridium sp.]
MLKRKRVAAYIRVSKDRYEQKSSLKNQEEQIIQYANDNGYIIVEIYKDIETGTIENRADFERLLKDAREDKFDIIISKEISRLARNVALSYKIKMITEDFNIGLITLDGSINTLEGCEELYGLHSWLAEHEAKKTSIRLKSMLTARAKTGLFNGSIPPYGYYCKKGKLFIRNDDTPEIIKRIFAEYIGGKGIDSIAKGLFNDNIPTTSQINNKKNASNVWYGSTIKDILTNQAYIGNMEQKKESTINAVNKKRIKNDASERILVENTHEPIISKETFYIVQELLKSRYKKRGHQTIHLFTNLLHCADCGKGMHFKKNRKGYVCATSVKLGKNVCSDHIVREAALSEAILKELNSFMSSYSPTSNSKQLEAIYKKKVSKFESAIKANEQKLIKLNERKDTAFNYLLDKTISRKEYDSYIAKYTKEAEILSNELTAFKSSLEILTAPSTLKKISSFEKPKAKIDELTPEILNKFIEKIEISEDGSPKIYYRF